MDAFLKIETTLPKELQEFISWKAGEAIPYVALVDTFEAIESHSGRLDKEAILTKLFRAAIVSTPKDLIALVYLASNAIYPAFEGLELGIGDASLIDAICKSTGRTQQAVKADYQSLGDLSLVSMNSRSKQKTLSFAAKPKPLTTAYILEQLREIAKMKGDKSQQKKREIIEKLMVRCQGFEAKYIIRSLQGKLRIGLAQQTVLVALANAFVLSPTQSILDIIKQDQEILKAKRAEKENEKNTDKDEDEDACKETDDIEVETVVGQNNMDENEEKELSSVELEALFSAIVEKEPPEANKLRRNYDRLTKENKFELAVMVVKRSFSECPSLDILVQSLLTKPLYAIHEVCRLIPGVPVAPMLAKPTKQISEVLNRLSGQAFTMEYKYDGERAQVHLLSDGSVKIFSRNSEDNSNKYPDLTGVIKRAKRDEITSCVFDAEIVAFDREKSCLLPFQILSTRKRKADEGDADSQKVKVVLQAFDLLFVNGKSVLSSSLRFRRKLLHLCFHSVENYFYFASGMDHVENGDTAPIETYLQEACASMCEGLMVKTLDKNASYEPSKRSLNWLKLKKDYIEGMGICDSFDLVVIGAYHGRGKRVNTYGAYLMACYDPENDVYQSVCKVGTGFKDEDLINFTAKMKEYIVPGKPRNYLVGDALDCDDWFDAKVLWEIKAADLSQSDVHKGAYGLIDKNRGIGLRFPRFLREREDKQPTQATSSHQVAEFYRSQDTVVAGDNGDDDEDMDFI